MNPPVPDCIACAGPEAVALWVQLQDQLRALRSDLEDAEAENELLRAAILGVDQQISTLLKKLGVAA